MRSSPDVKTKVVISETADPGYSLAYAKEDEKRVGDWKFAGFEEIVSCPLDNCLSLSVILSLSLSQQTHTHTHTEFYSIYFLCGVLKHE